MRLYDIPQAMEALLEAATDPETGEMDPGAMEALAGLRLAERDKLEGLALSVKNAAAEAEAIRREEEALRGRRQAAERRSERLRALLQGYLARRGLDGFATARCQASLRSSTAVDVQDEAALLSWARGREGCLRTPPPEVDKGRVRALLAAGVGVPGARLERRQYVTIR